MKITPALAPLLSSAEWAREPDERGGGRSRESPATAGLLHFLGAAAATTLGTGPGADRRGGGGMDRQ